VVYSFNPFSYSPKIIGTNDRELIYPYAVSVKQWLYYDIAIPMTMLADWRMIARINNVGFRGWQPKPPENVFCCLFIETYT